MISYARIRQKSKRLTTKSFPAFSGRFASLIAAAAAAPDDIPAYKKCFWVRIPLKIKHKLATR